MGPIATCGDEAATCLQVLRASGCVYCTFFTMLKAIFCLIVCICSWFVDKCWLRALAPVFFGGNCFAVVLCRWAGYCVHALYHHALATLVLLTFLSFLLLLRRSTQARYTSIPHKALQNVIKVKFCQKRSVAHLRVEHVRKESLSERSFSSALVTCNIFSLAAELNLTMVPNI